MNDTTSNEAIALRANQDDPIVMYLIVRESLGMSMGKACAQCAHASQMLLLRFNDLESKHTCGWSEGDDEANIAIFEEWLDSSFRKVVLKADDKEFEKVKLECLNHVLVVDAGLTEIAPNSETVIGLWPMHRSSVSKLIKRLQVLK